MSFSGAICHNHVCQLVSHPHSSLTLGPHFLHLHVISSGLAWSLFPFTCIDYYKLMHGRTSSPVIHNLSVLFQGCPSLSPCLQTWERNQYYQVLILKWHHSHLVCRVPQFTQLSEKQMSKSQSQILSHPTKDGTDFLKKMLLDSAQLKMSGGV